MGVATEILYGLSFGDMHAVIDDAVEKRTTLFVSVCKAPIDMYDIFIRRISNRLIVVSSFSREYDKVCHTIERELRQGGQVTVFCETGKQRSPSLIVAYLIIYGGLSYRRAIDSLTSKDDRAFPEPCIYGKLLMDLAQTQQVTDDIPLFS